MQRGELLGDPNGLRTELATSLGISITPAYIGEVMGNPTGGIKQGVIYDGLFNVPLDIDVDRLTHGLTHDLDFHVNTLWLQGQGLSVRHTGDFSNTSNIAGYNTVRLQETLVPAVVLVQARIAARRPPGGRRGVLHHEQRHPLPQRHVRRVYPRRGQSARPADLPGAAPGIRFSIQPTSKFSFQAGIYGGDSGGSQDQNSRGTNFNLRSRDGALIFSEVAYYLNQSPGDRGLTGTYKLGAFVHTGSQSFQTFDSQTRVALGTGNGEDRSTNYGVYGVVDQDLLKSGGPHDQQFPAARRRAVGCEFRQLLRRRRAELHRFRPRPSARLPPVWRWRIRRSVRITAAATARRAGRGSVPRTVVEATYAWCSRRGGACSRICSTSSIRAARTVRTTRSCSGCGRR